MAKLTLLELNEFSVDLLEQAVRVLPAPNLAKVLALSRYETTTEDIYDDGSLEPWVQWVSAHTGVPYGTHGILHIGDVPDRGRPQIWEVLSEAGISSGVWGVLNGVRRDAERCDFFVPDPWTFSEEAYPEHLQGLIALPRFLAKNRLSILKPELLPLGLQLTRSFRRPRHMAAATRQLARMAPQLPRDKDKAYVYFTAFEYLSAKRFAEYKRQHDPDFCVLFVNMLAHAQHYYWEPEALEHNPRMQYVLRYVDRVVGLVLDGLRPGEELVVMNGLPQFNISKTHDVTVYRQRDHLRFLALAGVRARSVDAHMTNDAHILFDRPEDLEDAVARLGDARVEGQPLFQLERYAEEPLKLFYKVAYKARTTADTTFSVGGRTADFAQHFEALGRHTGRHGTVGTAFTTLGDLPERTPIEGALEPVLRHFGIDGWAATS